MADEKKTAVVKPIAKAAVKVEAAKEEKKEAAAKEVAAPAKKAAAPKKAAPAKKAEAPKKAAPAKKAAAPKKAEAPKNTVYVQYAEKSYSNDDLVKIAKDVWVYDLKQKAEDFKSVDIYVKPFENVAYYVINGTETGSFTI